MFSLRCLPALKRGMLTAGRLIRSLVAGLIPIRSGRLVEKNDPKFAIYDSGERCHYACYILFAKSGLFTYRFNKFAFFHIKLPENIYYIENTAKPRRKRNVKIVSPFVKAAENF